MAVFDDELRIVVNYCLFATCSPVESDSEVDLVEVSFTTLKSYSKLRDALLSDTYTNTVSEVRYSVHALTLFVHVGGGCQNISP